MKRFQRYPLVGLALSAAGLLGWCAVPGHLAPVAAAPTASPSVNTAARLKYNPPPGWIRHYLGDDRYKIAGNVWHVVSTQMDTYYHRPNCPNMQRQPSNIVIGFSSADDAEEAGYRPDPVCRPEDAFVTYGGGSVTTTTVTTQHAVTTVNRGKAPLRITLADGASTVLLPPNWRRTQSGAVTLADRSALADVLQPLQGPGSITIAFMHLPGNINAQPLLTPGRIQQVAALVRQRGGASHPFVQLVDASSQSTGSVGGLSGVSFTPQTGGQLPGGIKGRFTIAARGSKLYLLDNASKAAGASVILNSIQPR